MNQKDKKKANILCWISLACAVIPSLLWNVTDNMLDNMADGSAGGVLEFLNNLADTMSLLGGIAALVLMIYVRVKYPKSVFGKVLMWLYIIAIIWMILCVIFLMVMCGGFMEGCNTCIVEMRGCDS